MAPVGKNFTQGVYTMGILPNGDLIIGAGDGALAKISIQTMKVKKRTKVWGAISSITFTKDYTHFFCGTKEVIMSTNNLISQVEHLLGKQ